MEFLSYPLLNPLRFITEHMSSQRYQVRLGPNVTSVAIATDVARMTNVTNVTSVVSGTSFRGLRVLLVLGTNDT